MATRYGPRIITDSLAMHLDAGDRNSYRGSGTTWFDLSGNNNHGTLVNSPTFSTNNSGLFTFNGSTTYVNLNGGSVLNNWNPDGVSASTSYRGYTSLNMWFRTSTISTGGVIKVMFGDNFLEYGIYHINSTLYTSAVSGKSTTISANVWYNVCLIADIGRPTTGTYSQAGSTTVTFTTTYPVTFITGDTVTVSFTKTSGVDAAPTNGNYVVTVTGTNTFTITVAGSALSSGTIIYSHSSNTSTNTTYINGVQLGSSSTSNTSNGANDNPFNVGRDNGSATSYFTGDISIVQLYNRNLTSSEVKQNFEAIRGRYGV